MIYVYISKELKPFETDIRDLCLAFFTLKKITYLFEDEISVKTFESKINSDDIVVKDYYDGSASGDRLKIKSEVKRQLYNYLSNLTGKKLLWGTLTGIRPVNIVTEIIENTGLSKIKYGKDRSTSGRAINDVMGLSPIVEIENHIYKENETIKEYLKKEYYISDEKAFELIKIARNEISILDRQIVRDYKDSYSVYVGVPFCKSTCLYCSFTSF